MSAPELVAGCVLVLLLVLALEAWVTLRGAR